MAKILTLVGLAAVLFTSGVGGQSVYGQDVDQTQVTVDGIGVTADEAGWDRNDRYFYARGDVQVIVPVEMGKLNVCFNDDERRASATAWCYVTDGPTTIQADRIRLAPHLHHIWAWDDVRVTTRGRTDVASRMSIPYLLTDPLGDLERLIR